MIFGGTLPSRLKPPTVPTVSARTNVMVHRFITKDTFEEKIDAMIQRKKHLAEMTVSTGESWIGKLSNKELHDIFG